MEKKEKILPNPLVYKSKTNKEKDVPRRVKSIIFEDGTEEVILMEPQPKQEEVVEEEELSEETITKLKDILRESKGWEPGNKPKQLELIVHNSAEYVLLKNAREIIQNSSYELIAKLNQDLQKFLPKRGKNKKQK